MILLSDGKRHPHYARSGRRVIEYEATCDVVEFWRYLLTPRSPALAIHAHAGRVELARVARRTPAAIFLEHLPLWQA